MKTLDRNASNDIHVCAHDLAFADGMECQCAVIDSLVNTQEGELQYDEKVGIDYFGTVFQGASYVDAWAAEVREKVKRLSFVSRIDSFDYTLGYESDRTSRRITWTMQVTNTDGNTFAVSSFRKQKKGTTMEINLDWENIENKPAGIDEAVTAVDAMRTAASGVSELTSDSTLAETKDVVNRVVLEPLQ